MQSGDLEQAEAAGFEAVVSVSKALERELKAMPAAVRGSTLAGSALALAKMLDDAETADTARTSAARELRETLSVLREQAAPAQEDRMTEFERRRDQREHARNTA